MKRTIETIMYSDDLRPGTFKYIKELEKAGFIKIVEVLEFEEHEGFDDIENLDFYWESLKMVVDYGKIQDGGYGFYMGLLKGLGLNVKWATKFEL